MAKELEVFANTLLAVIVQPAGDDNLDIRVIHDPSMPHEEAVKMMRLIADDFEAAHCNVDSSKLDA